MNRGRPDGATRSISSAVSGSRKAGTASPILYSFRRCPYAMRARLAIAASDQRCELREVVLRDKPLALLQASPKGTVPVFVLGAETVEMQVIDQSLDIMLWALAMNDPFEWLQPDQGDAASMRALISQCDGPFKQHLDRYKYPQRHACATDQPIAEYAFEHREQAGIWLLGLEALLQRGFLGGSRPALADMAILPFVRQFAHVDEAWFAAQPWPCLQKWLQDWKCGALFATAMTKFSAWREGDTPVYYPPI